MKNGDILYLVGEVTNYELNAWDYAGLYIKEEEAIDRCRDESFFIARVTVGEVVPDEPCEFEYAYYPKHNLIT